MVFFGILKIGPPINQSLCYNNQMKSKKYHTVGIVPKSNTPDIYNRDIVLNAMKKTHYNLLYL
jgi:hypothetical protein